MGSVPDGWWRDRAGAATGSSPGSRRLRPRVPAEALELPEHTWFPEWVAVVEGQARRRVPVRRVEVVAAAASGDDTIVAEAARLVAAGRG